VSRRPEREAIAQRLREWIKEANTNRYGMAHLANRAIAVLQAQMRQFDINT
jgi:hypothetical protein